jgi:hypothetical protein
MLEIPFGILNALFLMLTFFNLFSTGIFFTSFPSSFNFFFSQGNTLIHFYFGSSRVLGFEPGSFAS